MHQLVVKAEEGFAALQVGRAHVERALGFLEDWLTKDEYKEYVPQIEYLVTSGHWDYLLDSFYQIIPFGTGGRRGEVGVGPNRINLWTVQASAQGHSQYLLKKYGAEAKSRGVVFAYDVRVFSGNNYLNSALPTPVHNLTSKDFAVAAAQVYAANGITVHLFDGVRTTPELSFAVRHLNAVAGSVFSASHNPSDHNGKKVYDEFGGQLIPPDDEELVTEVTEKTVGIRQMSHAAAVSDGLIVKIDPSVDAEYINAVAGLSLSHERGLQIVYTPLHGCGMTSVYGVLQKLGFAVFSDPKTSTPSGEFENVTFNIPNPEVVQSFDTVLEFAKEKGADIILSTDPDADRIGVMSRHGEDWVFLNGNEIAAILTEYVIQKKKDGFKGFETVVKTKVTSNIVKKICEANNVGLIGELLVGFKYIADAANRLEKGGDGDGFLFGCEESHGYLAGSYARDKDAAVAAVWLSELAAELKKEDRTLVDYLDQIYTTYGYFRNYLTEIRLLGASGKEQIGQIQSSLREKAPDRFGRFQVRAVEDCLQDLPIVSETDRSAKNVLTFHLEAVSGTETIKITIRPSGTEPKVKMYFEIGTQPTGLDALKRTKEDVESILRDLEKVFMSACYEIIGVDFPERGFLLFWQLPLDTKLKYFEVEHEIEQLKGVGNKKAREEELLKLIAFLGSNPIEKMDAAFKAKYNVSVSEYLDLK